MEVETWSRTVPIGFGSDRFNSSKVNVCCSLGARGVIDPIFEDLNITMVTLTKEIRLNVTKMLLRQHGRKFGPRDDFWF